MCFLLRANLIVVQIFVVCTYSELVRKTFSYSKEYTNIMTIFRRRFFYKCCEDLLVYFVTTVGISCLSEIYQTFKDLIYLVVSITSRFTLILDTFKLITLGIHGILCLLKHLYGRYIIMILPLGTSCPNNKLNHRHNIPLKRS